jgi:RNA polymerase sigma-70 factor (ECF subfamily)
MESGAVARETRSVEALLVDRARAGDHDAFESLLEQRLEPTFRLAMAILGNEADARDATQEAFVRLWRSLPTLRDSRTFQAWFGRIVVNTCRTAIRGRSRRSVREIGVGSLPDGGEGLTPPGTAHDDRTADLDLLDRALDRLSVGDRTVLAMHHYQDLSLEQIGLQLLIPAATVKSRLFSARRALQRALEVERR